MYVADDLYRTKKTVRNLWVTIKVSTSIDYSENSRETSRFSEKVEKSRASLGKTISNSIGSLPSEQIFYRKIPLGGFLKSLYIRRTTTKATSLNKRFNEPSHGF